MEKISSNEVKKILGIRETIWNTKKVEYMFLFTEGKYGKAYIGNHEKSCRYVKKNFFFSFKP